MIKIPHMYIHWTLSFLAIYMCVDEEIMHVVQPFPVLEGGAEWKGKGSLSGGLGLDGGFGGRALGGRLVLIREFWGLL